MSLDDSGLYILNIIKNPQLAYPVFSTIHNNELKTTDDLIDATLLSKVQVNEMISFLQSLHLSEN